MKIDRNIAIVRSMLRSAIDNDDQRAILRLYGLLMMFYKEHSDNLEKERAKKQLLERVRRVS